MITAPGSSIAQGIAGGVVPGSDGIRGGLSLSGIRGGGGGLGAGLGANAL